MAGFGSLTQYVRNRLRENQAQYTVAGRVDLDAWSRDITKAVFLLHHDLVMQWAQSLLLEQVRRLARELMHGTRPQAARIARELANGQSMLPDYEAACHETYDDGAGHQWVLIDMQLSVVLQAAEAYMRRGRENTLKGERLMAVAREMQSRGFAPQDTVRRLWA